MSKLTLPSLLILLTAWALGACSRTPAEDAPYTPGFFYLSLSNNPTLMLSTGVNVESDRQIPLNPPTDCSFYALHAAPTGRWIAVEWECSFGPAVELYDSASGESHFTLSDPGIDSRFLAWSPDGKWLYIKIGALSIPQTLKVNAATGQAIDLSISPFSYDLAASPDGKHVLFSITKGIGFGSETWLAGPEGQNPSQLLVDAGNITALARYSPDGSQIAFIKFPDSQTALPGGELWVTDSGGFKPRKLADADAGRGFSPVWSPDGSRIAFVGRQKPGDPQSLNLSIYTLDDEKLVEYPVTPLTQPTWSPEGAQITFSSKDPPVPGNTPKSTVGGGSQPAGNDTMNVWLYEIASGQANILLKNACCAGWIR